MLQRPVVALVGIALIAVFASGCFQHTYDIGTGAPDGEEVYRHWHHHWLFGNIRPKHQERLDVAKLCPSGNATVHEEVSFLNGVIDVLIGVIYSPTTVSVRCDDGSSAEVELTAEEVEEIAGDPRFFEAVEELAPERLAEARWKVAELEAARASQ